MDDYLTKPIRCEALEERVLYLSVHFLFANFLSRKKKKSKKLFAGEGGRFDCCYVDQLNICMLIGVFSGGLECLFSIVLLQVIEGKRGEPQERLHQKRRKST